MTNTQAPPGAVLPEVPRLDDVPDVESVEPAVLEAPPERDRIVVLGRRQSGKTIYLASLYAMLWRRTHGLTAKALSGEAHKHLIDAHVLLRKGQWPPATLGTSRLEMELDYHGQKHLLVALDFAGEVFARAFLHEQTDSPEVKELLNHIDRAAAVLLLTDPAVGAGTDHEAVMEDDFGLVQAVQRIRDWPGGEQVPVVLVLTKMDVNQPLVKRFGGATGLVQHQFPALVRLLRHLVVVEVSAVQVARGPEGKLQPAVHSHPLNLEEPLKHCLRAIELARRESAQRQQQEQDRLQEELELETLRRRERRQIILLIVAIGLIILAGAAAVAHILHWFKWL